MLRRLPCSNWLTKRIKLVVAYDGTEFCGWAAQKDLRTVQSTLREAVRQVSGEDYEIVGASRTDSGAHARGQVCHFDASVNIEPAKWTQILNQVLPTDLSVVSSSQVIDRFHSRFCAVSRHYRYRISRNRDPRELRWVHYYWKPVDTELMHRIGQTLVGKHDFRGFSEELGPEVNSVRELFSLQVRQVRKEVWIDIVGTAFVRGMMRRISGALLEVGRGHRPPEDILALLTEKGRNDLQWPVVLPAKGLTLQSIKYDRYLVDVRKNLHASHDEDFDESSE